MLYSNVPLVAQATEWRNSEHIQGVGGAGA
jgi:hypothetical protein